VVSQVNATDADQGVDQRVRYRLEETSSDGYAIDENTGAIFLTREVDSGNSRILIVTAHSTKLKATTHITVDITGNLDWGGAMRVAQETLSGCCAQYAIRNISHKNIF